MDGLGSEVIGSGDPASNISSQWLLVIMVGRALQRRLMDKSLHPSLDNDHENLMPP